SQIKLFQKGKKSTIPNLSNLESFFSELDRKLKNLDRQRDYSEYIDIVRSNAQEIRDKVLKYLMVRRTRSEITKYFEQDLEQQGLKFPDVADPQPVFYELNDNEDEVFTETVELATKQFTYARYMPFLSQYYKGEINQLEEASQRNMGRFMRILLIKRLESSFYAFKLTVERFIHSYQRFLDAMDDGKVYISKKHSNKIFELLDNDDDAAIQKLIDDE